MKGDLTHYPVLVLEDNEDDAWLLQRALRRMELTHRIYLVRDGQEGIAYLDGRGKYADRNTYPVPRLIITDLKMPLLDGLEVLKWLRADEELRNIPILVLTSSKAASDVANAYGYGANSYMVKPSSLDGLEQLGKVIRDYWDACELPTSL